MNIKNYLKILNDVKANGGTFTCPYCGAKSLGLPSGTICMNCENVIPVPLPALYGSQQHLGNVENAYKYVKNNDYLKAYGLYEQLPNFQTDPFLNYSEALAYIENSNYEIALITYDKEGFMEDNTTHRNNSRELFSHARLLLNKAISLCEKEALGSDRLSITYLEFLAYLKLGDLKAAEYYLGRMRNSGSPFLENYAAMLLDNSMGEYDKALQHAELLLTKDLFVVNALYYAAYALFKKDMYKEAMRLLDMLPYRDESAAVGALLASFPI